MHAPASVSRTLALLACLSILAGCASSSPPTPPAPEVQIPSPPVSLGPQHSQPQLPTALDYSRKVQSYIDRLRALPTSGAPK